MRVLLAVRCSASRISFWSRPSKASSWPTTRRRIPLARSCATSRSSAVMNRRIRTETSSAGRRQFSELNANSVRNSIPSRAQASTVVRTASTPLAWPATRGSRRRVAQRPLPSMTMATWRGTLGGAGLMGIGSGDRLMRNAWRSSDRHDLLFLVGQQPVDIGDELVGELLHRVLGAALVVLGYFLVLDESLELVVGVAPQVADRHLRLLALGAHHLGQLAAALLGQRRHGHPQQVAEDRRIQAQVGLADR